MGLDTSHDAWHGSYGGFSNFRTALSEAAGYGPWTGPTWNTVEVRGWNNGPITITITEELIHGDWPYPPVDPLMYLLQHSDCNGVLPVKALLPLAERLEELTPKLPSNWGERAIQFAEGCRLAYEEDEEIVFA